MTQIYRFMAVACILVLSLTGTADAKKQAPEKPPENVLVLMKNYPELKDFMELIDDADLEDFMEAKGSKITVFAPTNKALKAVDSDVMDKVEDSKSALQKFVKNHAIARSRVFTASISGRKASPSTAAREMISFDGTGKELMVGKGKIVIPNLLAQNGVVHIIDAALVPKTMTDEPAPVATPAPAPNMPEALMKKDGVAPITPPAEPAVMPTGEQAPAPAKKESMKEKLMNMLKW